MTNDYKFSVLLSLYHKEQPEYLNESLYSIVNQTLKPDQIVIVYDGPVPECLDNIVKFYIKKSDIEFYVLKLNENVGLGLALNQGMKYCKYNYIARMDTDDISYSNRFEEQIKFLSNNTEISLLGSSIIEFDTSTRREKKLPSTNGLIRKYSKLKNPFNHMSVIFNKNDIVSVGGYKHHLYMEDYNLWLRLIYSGYKTANLSTPLLDVRSGGNMLNKRRGLVYIKSEYQLYKLKQALKVNGWFKNLIYFIVRVLPRIMPKEILSFIYFYDRAKTSKST